MTRRADRLFEIIQLLRSAAGPMTAAALASRLEVTVRTVYRDIAALQGQRIPIEGAAGIGYVLRPGFDMPPLMLTVDEVEAIATGVRLLRRIRDPGLNAAAQRVLAKVAGIVPGPLGPQILSAPLYVSDGSAVAPSGIDPAVLRRAIRERRKLRVGYRDAEGRSSARVLWPVAMAYYVDATLLAAWCELRRDFRHFRVERIETADLLDERFPEDRGRLLREWLAIDKDSAERRDSP